MNSSSQSLRILIAGFQHETNTFAPSLADWAAFNAGHTFPAYIRGQAMLAKFERMNIPIAGFVKVAKVQGWEVIPSMWAGAAPSSFVTQEAFERIASEICMDAKTALLQGLDAIYLDLHGAAVAQHVDDCEGELLARLRGIVGSEMPIVASLDLHANVTHQMLREASALVSYRTYPHIDMADTGALAAQCLLRILQHSRREPCVNQRIPYLIPLNAQSTWMQPAQGIYEALKALDAKHDVVMSFCMGFPAADIEECAPMIWSYGENAAQAVEELAAIARPPAQWNPHCLDVKEAVALAIERAQQSNKPIIIADTQDNPGAGGDSNTTGLLHELLAQGAGKLFPRQVALGLIYDPEAAKMAHQCVQNANLSQNSMPKQAISREECAGTAPENIAIQSPPEVFYEGALGKSVATFTGQMSDAPVQAKFRIECIHEGSVTLTGPMLTNAKVNLGACCALEIEGIRIAVASGKKQMLDHGLFSMLGIDPHQMKIMVVKSSNHFRAHFTPLVADPAQDIIIAKAAGPMAADPADLPWKKRSKHISARLPTM